MAMLSKIEDGLGTFKRFQPAPAERLGCPRQEPLAKSSKRSFESARAFDSAYLSRNLDSDPCRYYLRWFWNGLLGADHPNMSRYLVVFVAVIGIIKLSACELQARTAHRRSTQVADDLQYSTHAAIAAAPQIDPWHIGISSITGTMNSLKQYEIAFFGGQAPWLHDK